MFWKVINIHHYANDTECSKSFHYSCKDTGKYSKIFGFLLSKPLHQLWYENLRHSLSNFPRRSNAGLVIKIIYVYCIFLRYDGRYDNDNSYKFKDYSKHFKPITIRSGTIPSSEVSSDSDNGNSDSEKERIGKYWVMCLWWEMSPTGDVTESWCCLDTNEVPDWILD